jgi:hypothetical protein
VVGFFILSIFVTTALFLVVPLLAIANLFLWQSVYGPQLTPSEPQVLNDLLPYWAGFCFTVGFFLFFFLIWLTKNWQVYQIKTQQEAYTRALVEWSRYERTS